MTVFRVLTINIWNRQGPWPERRERLQAGIASLSPDIVGMQEVISRDGHCQAHNLLEGVHEHVAFGKARPLDATADYGNAITSRFPILEQQVHEIPVLDVDEPRSVLVTLLDTPAGTLPVLCTHYSWRLDHGYVREQQSVAIAAVLDGLPGTSLPPIFLGDLNAAPDEPAIRFLAGQQTLGGRNVRLTDCFAACGEGDGFTFDGRHNTFAEPWKEPPRRIDYIFVDGPDGRGRGKPTSARVVLTEVTEGIAASDHWGVLAELTY